MFLHDTTKIATGGIDIQGNAVKIWDAKTGESFSTVVLKHETTVWSLAWTPDGKNLICGLIRIFDTSIWQ